MVGNVVPKQRRENAVPPPVPSKAAAATRRAVESTIKKKEGAGLADLRDADKAKVARLINHVMMAFKEIQRLKELMELERSTQEALVTKLQKQNHEVATEEGALLPHDSDSILNEKVIAQLRLKLASLQPTSPLSSQKVYLHPGRRPSLSPIREAEYSEAESEVTRSQAPESNAATVPILRERENHSSDFTTTAGGKDNAIFNKSEGTEPYHECAPEGECQSSCSQGNNVSESRGKENKDPELLPQCKPATQMGNGEDAAVLPKRPPPRPLPDLLSNILHRCRDVAHQSESPVTYVSNGDASNSSAPILQGKLNPVPQLPPKLAQISSRVDLDGYEYTARLEAAGKVVLGTKHSQGGPQHEALNSMVHTQCKCTAFHQCLPNCLHHLKSSNLSNVTCPEQPGGSEKVLNEMGKHEQLIEPKICASQKKLRFDPTAGEEGIFYYVSDDEKNAKENPEIGMPRPTGPEETQRVQVGGKSEPLSFGTSQLEGQTVDRDTLESHWTPEAIERRNSFHKIPVAPSRSTSGNEGHADERRSLFSGNVCTKIVENKGSYPIEHEELPTSESELLSIGNEKPHPPKRRPPSHGTSKCISCSSIVPRRSERAPLSSKLSAKYPSRCSKCSSIIHPVSPKQSFRESDAQRGRLTGSDKHSNGKLGRQNSRSSTEACECGTEDDFDASDQSTTSNSGKVGRCGKCATRLKSRSLPAALQKPKRQQVGMKNRIPPEEEVSDPASVVYRVASDDMYMSTHSSTTDYSITARRNVPSFPLKVCRIDTRKIRKKRGSGREMKSVKLLGDESSEPSEEVFHVNRDVLDMLLQSDGKYRGQGKPPLPDSTKCWIESWRFGKSHKSPHKGSLAEEGLEQMSKASSGSFGQNGQLDAEFSPRGRSTLNRDVRQTARRYDHVQGRKQSSEKWKHFEVDDLLDRFIQSNAECAAELIKCSVYFESTSTSSRPSSRSTLMSENPNEGKPPVSVDHPELASAQPHPEESVQCSKCGVCITAGLVRPLVGAVEMVETKERRDVCDTCSASVTTEEVKVMRRSADLDESRQSVDNAPPIVLPRVSSDDVLKTHEAGLAQRSSTIQICNVKTSGDWASEALHDSPDLSMADHRMPIITGVSVSSRRTTPPGEMEDDDTAKELTEMFDMSLYDLVNDLEGQRRDYWRRVNSRLDGGKRIVTESSSRRGMVDVEVLQRSSTVRRMIRGKQVHSNHFR